ncbi:Uncharacterised protein [Mycobacterium tuberculosis]|uniref:Uncharacterized protein n=1 Tax=Mycobacterium tuberculosis TaxID=1773 RepID=A0A655FJJ3_MYCTX|nr:Uncharacterised protein [Mycobacterium tuberculosis]CKR50789.1 Uncharacterised protein [Mycobacterium tuberculosis]CKR87041.1 Uncharacterised protein [Mycobacterium tuberculosis]CKT32864.1 Uncharacterised protein [Mycobacterium tuberculosis]CKT53414.1 Uncharacterised protein [Mycobacterium tuberculosis]
MAWKLGAKIVACSHPTASITAIASWAQNFGPSVVIAASRDDRPTPRWSRRITLLNDARRRWKRYSDGSSSIESIGTNGPGNTSRSVGPSPSTW